VTDAWVILGPGTPAERPIPIRGRLLVGRECAGVEASRRLIIDDPEISRDHLELFVDPGRGARLVDTSTNGTFLNDRRVERGVPVPLGDGDVVELGSARLVFRAPDLPAPVLEAVRATIRARDTTRLAVVVGDLVGYTALTEAHGGGAAADATDALFSRLRALIDELHGTALDYVGDAILVGWDAGRDPAAATAAVGFALEAGRIVDSQPVRAPDGAPLHMGWGVALGDVSRAGPSPAHALVHGDAINLAFRLAGMAAREGRPAVLVTEEAVQAAPGAASYGTLERLAVRGRSAPAAVRGATPG
jgi:adenylate cyclase